MAGLLETPYLLRRLADFEAVHLAFVLARPKVTDQGDLIRVIQAVSSMAFSVRVSLLVSPRDLLGLGSQDVGSFGVGLTLDVADAETPFSVIASEHLDAVRFAPDFALECGASVRGLCVLNAMLGLARHVGHATLGPDSIVDARATTPAPRFDYVWAPDAKIAARGRQGPNAARTISGNATPFPAR
jgi:hypothetical protein